MYLCSTIQKSEEDAIYQTMEDRDELACIIMDISPDANLDRFFRPLENNRSSEMILGKEKGRPHRRSWLRLYAIKLSVGIYIITGGAIKLTRTMQEREHTLQELEKMEKVRNFLNSRKIAIKVAVSMKRQGLSRQDVADRMGCSPQYISKLLKGEENLSLETICKLEDALNIAILQYEFA